MYISAPSLARSVEHCSILWSGISIFDKAFWFLLIWDSVIPLASKPILHSLKREWSAEQWYGKDGMLRWSTFKKLSLSGGSFNSLGLKYLVILTFCSCSAPRLIFYRNWVFSRICVWATFFLIGIPSMQGWTATMRHGEKKHKKDYRINKICLERTFN